MTWRAPVLTSRDFALPTLWSTECASFDVQRAQLLTTGSSRSRLLRRIRSVGFRCGQAADVAVAGAD
jgi:hypothetical protein